MPLHLQHHKSYHPYRRENIERVRKDEEKARREAEREEQRTLIADSEARINLLRKHRASKKDEGGDLTTESGIYDSKRRLKDAERALDGDSRALERYRQPGIASASGSGGQGHDGGVERLETKGHINFWADMEGKDQVARLRKTMKNPENVADEKAEADKWDAQITMYLDKPAKELRPWYSQPDLMSGEERKKSAEQRMEAAYKDNVIKSSNDPLKTMESYLAQRESALAKAEMERLRGFSVGTPLSATPSSAQSQLPRGSNLAGERGGRQDFGWGSRARGARSGHRAGEMRPPDRREARPSLDSTADSLRAEAQSRESAERARAEALMAAKRRQRMGISTPSEAGTPRSEYEYSDQYYKDDVRRARESRRRRGWGD